MHRFNADDQLLSGGDTFQRLQLIRSTTGTLESVHPKCPPAVCRFQTSGVFSEKAVDISLTFNQNLAIQQRAMVL